MGKYTIESTKDEVFVYSGDTFLDAICAFDRHIRAERGWYVSNCQEGRETGAWCITVMGLDPSSIGFRIYKVSPLVVE